MRSLLRRLGPRYGIGLGSVLLIAAIVGIARLVPDGVAAPPDVPRGGEGSAAAAGPPATVPSGPATAVGASPDGGLHSPEPPETLAGTPGPAAVARSFAQAWLAGPHEPVAAWVGGMSAYATADLAAELPGADPSDVPATRITGPATVVDDAAASCEVDIPTDAGTLLLTLTAAPAASGAGPGGDAGPGGGASPGPAAWRWLVAAIDWRPA